MYLKLNNEIIEKYPYSIGDLRRDNPQTSFPANPSKELLAQWGVFSVTRTLPPEHDPITENLVESKPKNIDGQWAQVWLVTVASPEEIEHRKEHKKEQVRQQRIDSYRNESDPLFFKAQRGETTMQEWQDKVAEIKARFPKE